MQQPRSQQAHHVSVVSSPGQLPPPDCLVAAMAAASKADWSVAEVGRWLHLLTGWAGQLAPSDRFAWQAGLRALLRRHGWAMSRDSRKQVLDLAWRWHDWPLVIAAGEWLADDAGHQPVQTRALACAHWHMGEPARALALLYPLIVTRPDDRVAYALYCDIEQWWHWQQAYPLVAEVAADDELRLEPLGEHHLHDFAWQYHDPSIAELCCLPNFTGDHEWIDWLRQTHGLGDQLLFAVLHKEWGFIGSVSLILHRGVGFFYYWIGAEYQGSGFGPRAVSMMLRYAQGAYGMHACYAKAYADNYPSRRGLSKLGFTKLTITPVQSCADELFFRYGAEVCAARATEELLALLKDMGAEVGLCRSVGRRHVGLIINRQGQTTSACVGNGLYGF